MFSLRTISVLALAAAVSALPTATDCGAPPPPTQTKANHGATHSVVVGRAGQLIYDPDNVVAEVGDIVEFHFQAKNHSVAQSSFAKPCEPIGANAIFAGFNFVTATGQNPNVFQIEINDTKPVWVYCPQTTGNHCQKGMSMAINQDFNSQNTLANYKKAAALTTVSGIPPVIQGGLDIPNPNPLSGF